MQELRDDWLTEECATALAQMIRRAPQAPERAYDWLTDDEVEALERTHYCADGLAHCAGCLEVWPCGTERVLADRGAAVAEADAHRRHLQETREALRRVTDELGDHQWGDDAHLGEVLERCLARPIRVWLRSLGGLTD